MVAGVTRITLAVKPRLVSFTPARVTLSRRTRPPVALVMRAQYDPKIQLGLTRISFDVLISMYLFLFDKRFVELSV